MFHHKVTQHVVIVLNSADQYGYIMIMDLINEMHILRWHLKTNIVLFTLPMIPFFIFIDSELHVLFIQIYSFEHERPTKPSSLRGSFTRLRRLSSSQLCLSGTATTHNGLSTSTPRMLPSHH